MNDKPPIVVVDRHVHCRIMHQEPSDYARRSPIVRDGWKFPEQRSAARCRRCRTRPNSSSEELPQLMQDLLDPDRFLAPDLADLIVAKPDVSGRIGQSVKHRV